MSRVTLSASAALVLLLAACGGSSSGDGPTLDEQIDNELDDNDGQLTGRVITTPDGRRYVVDAVDPNADGNVSGYVIAGQLDGSNNIIGINQATIAGRPYDTATTTGRFDYSGDTVALLSKDGGNFNRLTGESELTIDFGNQTGRIESFAEGGGATAEVEGSLTFDRTSGSFEANSVRMEYTDDTGTRSGAAGVFGSLHGDNEGFSGLYDALGNDGIEGVGVMAGDRD